MARRPPTIASQHADWLRLIDVSGPFLSLPVLVRAFSHGLDKVETETLRRVRTGYAEWKENTKSDAAHRSWIDSVISGPLEHESPSVLRFGDSGDVPTALRHRVEEHAEVLVPQLVIGEADQECPDGARVLVCIYPHQQRLDRGVAGSRWSASPHSRMTELCRATGVRLGLVTNGEQWTLVDALKDETIGYATWYAQLWLDEPTTLAAFRSLLGRHRLFAVGQGETLEALLTKSREDQHEVTTQLGLQVRRAVEVLVRAIDRADQDSNRALLKDVPVTEIYQAAVTVMMRLVFLLSAEERGLLLLGDPLFDQHYAVSTLCEQLREVADQHGEEVLERRRDAWCRLLAAFRAVHGGVQHDRLQIRAYGGGLFDPDRFPFLEGRPKGTAWRSTLADPLPIDNRTVLHALESLQFLQVRIGGHTESRRLSFRALGIEQIGHIYEGLLDHTAVRAKDITLGLLGPDGAEAEVPLAALEESRRRGEAHLIDFLHEHKVKSGKPAIKKLLAAEVPAVRVGRLERLCRDAATGKRVEPYAALIRDDDFGQPIILLPGQLYATAGQDRRSTGTHYTPRSLTEPTVEHSLEPLVYTGPADGKPREEWQLRSAKEILDLRVCDMACGSGAFLVQACRYLADRLLDSWAIAEKAASAPNPGKVTFPTITFDGTTAKGERDIVPRDPDERLLVARRLIAQRCLYGVDINPVAVEMAKLSIWLLTLSKDRPFSFLDHAIRSGDSLLGLHDLEQLRRFTLDRSGKEEVTFNQLRMTDLIEKASGTRLQIEHINSENIGHVQVQARLLGEAEKQTERLKFAADMLISGYLTPARSAGERQDAISSAAVMAGQLVLSASSEELREFSARVLGSKRPFHWCLEFPEVFGSRGGFDSLLGNPPYLGSMRIAPALGDEYLAYLKTAWPYRRGNADLVVYFLLQASVLAGVHATIGLLLNKTVAEGKSREIGLDWLLSKGWSIYRAAPKQPWPGEAGATVSRVHLWYTDYRGERLIDDIVVPAISSYLDCRTSAEPHTLRSSAALISQGTVLLGDGFKISPDKAREWIARKDAYSRFLFPFANGADVNTHPSHAPSDWVICFDSLDEDAASTFEEAMAQIRQTVKPQRDRLTRQIHEYSYWKHWDKRSDAYRDLRMSSASAIVIPIVSKYLNAAVLPSGWMFSNKLAFLRTFDWALFGAIQSNVYWAWAMQYISSLGSTLSFSISKCFATWPLPIVTDSLRRVSLEYHTARAGIASRRNWGLTEIYNGVHSDAVTSADIAGLRALQTQLDVSVCDTYSWQWKAEDLRHGFYETPNGQLFTIHPDARAEILARLLSLNHQRHAEEVAAGLHGTRKSPSKVRSASTVAANRSGVSTSDRSAESDRLFTFE
jgi:hypothetical protein